MLSSSCKTSYSTVECEDGGPQVCFSSMTFEITLLTKVEMEMEV